MVESAQLEFVESRDTALLNQYFELRQRTYRRHYPTLPEDFGQKEAADGSSCILLTCYDGRVWGGARLTISRPECPRRLPLEEGGYRLKNSLPEFDLEHRAYGEISRLAVDSSVPAAGMILSQTLGHRLCQIAARHGVEIVFSICPRGPARINEKNSKRCGIEFRMIEEISTAFGIRMWLCAYLTTGAVQCSLQSS